MVMGLREIRRNITQQGLIRWFGLMCLLGVVFGRPASRWEYKQLALTKGAQHSSIRMQ